MPNDNRKDAHREPLALHSPPSNPGAIGEVWIGQTCPSPSLLAEAFSAPTLAEAALQKARDCK